MFTYSRESGMATGKQRVIGSLSKKDKLRKDTQMPLQE